MLLPNLTRNMGFWNLLNFSGKNIKKLAVAGFLKTNKSRC
jgi:hypothetical protein